MGCGMVTSLVSGMWVLCKHDLISWVAQGYTGCHRHRCRDDLWVTAGVVGSAVVCGFGVTGITGATGAGGRGCAGLVGAGCGAETWGLAGACSMAVVASGTV